jgi:hypothetical protein
MQPRIVPIKNGFAAVGDGWAVFGPTEKVAQERYEAAERQHEVIRSRVVPNEPKPPASQSLTAAQA